MSGRPKGTTKSDSKKLQTYRLSAIEKYEVENLLTVMRDKSPINLPDIRKFEFKTKRLCANYICIDPILENIKCLYVIIGYDFENFLIVKCPVFEITSKSYVATIYARDFDTKDNIFRKSRPLSFKVMKETLQHSGLQDFNLIHYCNGAFKTLEEALGFLYSNCLKEIILNELLKSNNIALMFAYFKITAANNNEAMALEYVYNVLALNLFSIEDDTKNTPKNSY